MTGARVLAVDNFDSFTFTLVDYLRQLDAAVLVIRNDEVTITEALGDEIDAILLSPGPGRPEEAGIIVELASACIERNKPLLGICLGHQAIALACGASVERTTPVHGKVQAVEHDSSGIFTDIPSPIESTRYHSLAVRDLRPPLRANARAADGVIMGLRHETAPVHGIQFHPESIGSAFGHRLLGNFLALALDRAHCVA